MSIEDPEPTPAFARTLAERPNCFAGVPNTLPPQDWDRNAEFGRVGCAAP